MARLYADEDLANFVRGLRDAGHDVLSAGDVGRGRTDPWHLQRAAADERMLVTFNEPHYRYLHRLWTSLRIFGVLDVPHAGIVTATEQLQPNAWIPALNQLFERYQQMAGRMFTWHPGQQDWHEDRWRPED